MVKNSILYPLFDEVMRKLIPSGIPQYLPEFHFFLQGNNDWTMPKRPRILNLDDLSFLFILWISACGCSLIIFAAEIYRYPMVDKIIVV